MRKYRICESFAVLSEATTLFGLGYLYPFTYLYFEVTRHSISNYFCRKASKTLSASSPSLPSSSLARFEGDLSERPCEKLARLYPSLEHSRTLSSLGFHLLLLELQAPSTTRRRS